VRAKQREVHDKVYPKVNANVNIEISSEGLLKDISFRYINYRLTINRNKTRAKTEK